MDLNTRGNRDIVELWGREFNVVKNGLSEAQVVAFVSDLTKQHDVLRQRQEHLISLTALAERTVSEADKLAEELKVEERKQAEERAANLIAESQASAKADGERLLKEAQAVADKNARDLENMALEDGDKAARELKENAEAEAQRMIGEAEAKGRQIIEQKVAEATAAATAEAEAIISEASKEASTLLEREKRRVQPQISQFTERLRGRLLSELEQFKSQVIELQPQMDNDQPTRNARDPSPLPDRAERRDEFLDLMNGSDTPESGEPKWEIEIMPPIDIMKIMSIVSQVDGLSGVTKTEIIPRNDRTSIMVYTSSSVNVNDFLRTLPEVAHAGERKGRREENAGPRRVSVTLSNKKSKDSVRAGDEVLPETHT
jgi:cell division septum initiation protein DivIVA